MPVVSVAKQARLKGYFHLEWKWLSMATGIGRAEGAKVRSSKI